MNKNGGKNGGKNGKGDGDRKSDGKGGESREAMMRRLDAEIDGGSDIRRREERDSLRMEGVKLLMQSRGLMEISILLVIEADRLSRERDGLGVDYDKLEEWYREVEVVDSKLREVNRVIKEMEMKYRELRLRVNKFYGVEVMGDFDDVMDKMKGSNSIISSLLGGDNNLFDGTPGEDGEGKDDNKDKDDDGYKDRGGGIGIEDEKGFGFNIGDDGDGFKEGDPDWWKK